MDIISFFPLQKRISQVGQRIKPIKTMQVIIKTVERCNLACTYCYYFFHGDESYKDRDPVMRKSQFSPIAEFLKQGAIDLKLERISIVFHGGEPTLQKTRDFALFCSILYEQISPVTKITFGIQTNGLHLTDEWLDLFEQYDVHVGVSIDGPKEYQDHYRLDHDGKGSYERIALNINRLMNRVQQKRIKPIGFISVMDSNFSTRSTFSHLAEEFGVKSLSFLLPDRSRDKAFRDDESPQRYGQLLCELFDVWVENQDIDVREIKNIVNFFQLLDIELDDPAMHEKRNFFVTNAGRGNEILVIQSTGKISIDDSLIPALDWRQSTPSLHVSETSLYEFIHQPAFLQLEKARNSLPDGCAGCSWAKACGGGALENRYSRLKGFNNPSVYCEGLKVFYEHVTSFLLKNGYPKNLAEKKLSCQLDFECNL